MANAIFEAYLIDDPSARRFFPNHFADPQARRSSVARALERPIAPDVLDAIRAQNRSTRARSTNLDALAEGAAAVVTGQQVGLFLGPLFTVYKAASCIRAAQRLSSESGRPVVPIFWLQTEDHDLPEIASCRTPSARGAPLCLSLEASPADRISVAHRVLPAEVTGLYAMLAAELTGLPHAGEALALVERHYRPGSRWGVAFAGMLAELFEGLIVIDPRDPAFARIARSVHQLAIEQAGPIARALIERSEELRAGGFDAQVQVRPEIPLSFFHPDGPESPRTRIDPDRFDPAALDRPLAFSTSALLRPILQDSLLPTAAYVGGPAEVAYFAQLEPLYRSYRIPQPMIIPRARLRLIEEKIARIMARLSLAPDDAALSEDALLARVCRPEESAEELGDRLLEPLARELAQIRAREPSLEKAVEKTLDNVRRSVGKLMEKYQRTQLRRDHLLLDEVRHFKLALLPEGAPQERYYSLPYYLARYGRGLIERLVERIDPFDPAPKDVALP